MFLSNEGKVTEAISFTYLEYQKLTSFPGFKKYLNCHLGVSVKLLERERNICQWSLTLLWFLFASLFLPSFV